MLTLPAGFVDPSIVQRRIDELGSVGRIPGGGLYRGVYSASWRLAMGLVRDWMEGLGFETRVDPVGNLIRAKGRDIFHTSRGLSGSHLDTVIGGGKYDGALGVIAALTAVEGLVREFGQPRKTLEVLAICEEEGSRFRCNFWGSRAISGLIAPGDAESLWDAGGTNMAEAMAEVGLDPALISHAAREDIDAFLELHVEQGPVLESAGRLLGVVDRITGMSQLEVTVTGRQNHAGTTPMDLRRDAMVGAAEMIACIAEKAASMGRPAVATVGSVHASPGAVNVVPGRVTFTVDARHSLPERRKELQVAIEGVLAAVAERLGLGLEVRSLMDHGPVVLHETLRSQLEGAARDEGLDYLVMPSGAGHDSQILAQRFPAAMLFVPSEGGRSHTPEENTHIEPVVAGIRVLARELYRLAY